MAIMRGGFGRCSFSRCGIKHTWRNLLMDIRLIALDMDGTLLDSSEHISPENRKWIRKAPEAGIAVCCATGRGINSVELYVQELGLDTLMVLGVGSEAQRN